VSTEPLSYQLLEALQAQLQTIAVDNGFRTDLGEDIRLEAYSLEELAGEISLRAYVYATELTRDAANSSNRIKKDRVGVVIEAIVPTSASDGQRVAHRTLADLRRALDQDERQWLGEGLGRIEVATQSIELRPAGLRLIVVQLGLSVMLTETVTRT
jgi:hypothetical protein